MKNTMKNTTNHAGIRYLRIIRISVFFLLVAMNVFAQVTVKAKNMPIRQILTLIEKSTEYKFFYNDDFTALDKVASLNVNNVSIDKALTFLFTTSGISWEKKDKNQIVLVPEKTSNQDAPLPDGQTHKVYGVVTDATTGETLLGVSVFVEGTKIGVISDLNGRFSIEAPGSSPVLVFSYIGYVTKKAINTKQNNLKIALEQSVEGLDEVIVVGYGTQKKINLTGAVASVNSNALESRPITQASQALAGLMSGVSVSQGSGRPGNDGSAISIRGMGSFGMGNNPLVLIDGIASSLNDVDPNNIKSISVLKDPASAAIYGSRAANGVILVETKRGEKGKMQVSYDNYVGWQKVTELPQFVDSYEYATLKGGYTADQIAKYKDGSDPVNYPNVPHLKNLLNTGSGFQTNHNLSLMGGDVKNSYLLSLGYLQQDGVVAKNDYEKYNFLMNYDSQIKKNLNLKFNLSGNTSTTDEPRSSGGDMMAIIGMSVREPNTYSGKNADGTYGHQDAYSPEAWLDSKSFARRNNHLFSGVLELSWELLKGLTLSGKAGYKYYNYSDRDYTSLVTFDPTTTIGPNKLTQYSGDNALITLQSLLRYEKRIGDHNLSGLVGFSQESSKDNWTWASRDNFINDELYELNAGAQGNMQNAGSSSEWSLRSYFGRINYDFKSKYLLEVNARYDGSSRFLSKNTWGFFPSVSGGWRVSEEAFLKDNISWIDNLKLRASWGRLGNQQMDSYYPYQNVLSLGQNYSLGGILASGVAMTNQANTNVHWETTEGIDIGMDLSVLKNHLSLTFDYFDKSTSDILYSISVPSVLGLTSSPINAGAVNNKGFEVMLNYQAVIGKLHIGVSPNFSVVDNKITKLANGLQNDIGKGLFVGHSLGSIYGFVADGLFKDAADVASYATQPYSAEPGLIRYKDISGPDGVPDGKVDATYDKKVIGSTLPKYTFGATLNAEFHGIDLSVLLQGLGGYDKQMGSYQAFALYNGGNIQRWQADNAWTEANPNVNAVYPKIQSLNMGSGTIMTSTYWNRDATFLRLKNVQIGYSFPESFVQKLSITKLRIFFSGQNLFSANHFYTGWDPEMSQNTGDNPAFYPITSVYSFGLSVKL